MVRSFRLRYLLVAMSLSLPKLGSGFHSYSQNTFRHYFRYFASSTEESILRHQITWKTADMDIVFEAVDGETLRTAALRRGLVSPHNGRANVINCRGLGTCGTCAVEISGNVEPAGRNAVEDVRLSLPPHDASSKTLRLACQVQVRGTLTVTKRTGFWGQKEDVAKASQPTRPFGKLEYVLDNKSPGGSTSTTDGKET